MHVRWTMSVALSYSKRREFSKHQKKKIGHVDLIPIGHFVLRASQTNLFRNLSVHVLAPRLSKYVAFASY